MGDRALIIFKSGKEFSPAIYLHHYGQDVPKFLKEHSAIMETRKNDLQYASARFVGLCHTKIEGNLSLGMWVIPESEIIELIKDEKSFCKEFSHGDAGVFVVDVKDFSWKQYGGYKPKKV